MLSRLILLTPLIFFLNSCGTGCVAPDEFDQEVVTVESNPTADGIVGSYDTQTGGQRAEWHKTGLKSNGDQFAIKITGAWTPWQGDYGPANENTIDSLPTCNFCPKLAPEVGASANPPVTIESSKTNCICRNDQTPAAEKDIKDDTRTNFVRGDSSKSCDANTPTADCETIDCTKPEHQNDPNLCTCTKSFVYPGLSRFTTTEDYGVYHFPLNHYDKNHETKKADDQTACKYDSGMGLYLGLSSHGNETKRAYHLYSKRKGCDIPFNSDGKCIPPATGSSTTGSTTTGSSTTGSTTTGSSAQGTSNTSATTPRDQSYTIYFSPNNRILVRDDKEGNFKVKSDTSGDVYHGRNEDVKFIIYDNYYSDNYGSYNLQIYRGVGLKGDDGLLEFLVDMVESVLFGKTDANGVTQESIIQSMHNAIVRDSGFARIVQFLLVLYVTFFGVNFLLGTIEMDENGVFPKRKEILLRILKIGLVMLFIDPYSWHYNMVVVSFFRDGMNDLMKVMMDSFDSFNDNPTSIITLAREERANDATQATRFSEIDIMIKKMFSSGTAKKVFGLFFSTFFAMIYIPIIYMLMFAFLAIMLFAASLYLISLIKIVFVLALGPIFICFSLFEKTKPMFKNWIGFLGARSLEVVIIFAVLHNFLELLDVAFNDMLFYRTCVKPQSFGLFSVNVLKADTDRPFKEWMAMFTTFGGLLFITQMVLMQVPTLTSQLIKIGDVASGKGAAGAGSTLAAAVGMAKDAGTAMAAGLNKVKDGAGFLAQNVTAALDASGLSDLIPFRSPRGIIRDNLIDSAIEKAQAEAAKRNMSAKDTDQYVRKQVHSAMIKAGRDSGSKEALAGVTTKAVNDRLQKKLVDDKLQDFIKKEADKMKDSAHGGDVKLGKEAREHLEQKAREFAKNNLCTSDDSVTKSLKGLSDHIATEAELSTSQAAKMFAGNAYGQEKYLRHLNDLQKEGNEKDDKAEKGGVFSYLKRQFEKGYDNITREVATNPEIAAANFLRKVSNEEEVLKEGNSYSATVLEAMNAMKVNVIAQMMTDKWDKMAAEKMAKLASEDQNEADSKKSGAGAERDANVSEREKAEHERKVIEEKEKELVSEAGKAIKAAKKEADEAAALAEKYDKMKAEDPNNPELERLAKEMKDLKEEMDKKYAQPMFDVPEEKKSSEGFITTMLKFEGLESPDVGLHAGDIGLKGANVLLGSDEANGPDPAKAAALAKARLDIDIKKRMVNLDKRTKEYDLAVAQKSDDKNAIAKLSKELDAIDVDLRNIDHQMPSE